MKIEINLSDDQVAHVARVHNEQKKVLAKGNEREILVGADDRRAIEALVQTTIGDSKALVKHVSKLCQFKIGNVTRTFAPDELARIDMQAKFHNRTRDVFIKEMVDEIVDRMLEKV